MALQLHVTAAHTQHVLVELKYLSPQGGNIARDSINWAVMTVVKERNTNLIRQLLLLLRPLLQHLKLQLTLTSSSGISGDTFSNSIMHKIAKCVVALS